MKYETFSGALVKEMKMMEEEGSSGLTTRRLAWRLNIQRTLENLTAENMNPKLNKFSNIGGGSIPHPQRTATRLDKPAQTINIPIQMIDPIGPFMSGGIQPGDVGIRFRRVSRYRPTRVPSARYWVIHHTLC